MNRTCIVVTGPTGVGKTGFVDYLAKKLPIEVINADVGQLYTPLTIGTAKPDLSAISVPHHGFNVLDTPRNFTVTAYRDMVLPLLEQIYNRNTIPVFVGGSLFYIKSIFFPPAYVPQRKAYEPPETKSNNLWQQVHAIDPERARAIHPNDTYRLQRALAIWYETGQKPSTFVPQFAPPASAHVSFLSRERAALYERINERTHTMLANGWIAEVQNLDAAWWDFLRHKNLIGYPDIITYLENGMSYDELVDTIQRKTRLYAKRQITFWRSLRTHVIDAYAQHEQYTAHVETVHIDEIDGNSHADAIATYVQGERNA